MPKIYKTSPYNKYPGPCNWFECPQPLTQARGLCYRHYSYCCSLVEKGIRTWDELELGGIVNKSLRPWSVGPVKRSDQKRALRAG